MIIRRRENKNRISLHYRVPGDCFLWKKYPHIMTNVIESGQFEAINLETGERVYIPAHALVDFLPDAEVLF